MIGEANYPSKIYKYNLWGGGYATRQNLEPGYLKCCRPYFSDKHEKEW